MKLSELKTHFADIVVEENERFKAKLHEDYENKMSQAMIRKEYAASVKRPKIDEQLRVDLISEIKKPSSFLGRQCAHADLTYSLHGLQTAVPKSNYLSNTPFPEVNVSKFGTGRNSIQAQLGTNDSTALKRDRDYIRRIIQDSKEQRSQSVTADSPKQENKLIWDQ